MRHPAQRRPRRLHGGQVILPRSYRQRMTLLASLPPQKLLGIIDLRRNPLVRGVHSHGRLHWPTRQIASRVARLAQLPWMRRNILAKFLHEKRVHYFRLVVWHALIEASVKSQRMTSGTCICESHWRHQLTPAYWHGTLECSRFNSEHFVFLRITSTGSSVFRVSIL